MAPEGERWRTKFLGCLVGSALGDAIGELAFMHPGKDRLRSVIEGASLLRYTDDTAMALGLAESLVARGRLDPEHLGRTFHRNYDQEPWRGYASGPPTIFRGVAHSGVSYVEAAKRLFGGAGSLGNGAAMRVAPLGLFFCQAPDLYAQAAASASVTHAHPLAADGAAVQALAVARAARLDPRQPFDREDFLQALLSFSRTAEIREKLSWAGVLLQREASCQEAARVLGRSVMIHESLPFALYAFLKHPQSYEDCLYGAILHGGDRDTLGAMAGAVSGAYLGSAAIPRAWWDRLENRELIEALAASLLKGGRPCSD
jgi:poly(ADP-ribose) glycohydrolase ARH3